MREEKEIREALKRINDEYLRKRRHLGSYSILEASYRAKAYQAMVGALKWVLGDREGLPDFARRLASSDLERG
ncbi:hypothetical protein ES705_14959 [subsurface metagenome]